MPHQDAQEVVLAAFLHGDDQTRKQIMAEVTPDQLYGWDWVYEIMLQLLQFTGKLEISDLYKETKKMVDGYLPNYMEDIDEAFVTELPDEKSLNDAIALLLSDARRTTDEQDWAEKAVLAAMLKGDKQIRTQLLESHCGENFEHFNRANLIEWAEELYLSKGLILKEDLSRKMEEYMTTRLLPSYTLRIDHLLEAEIPDKDSLTAAISWVKQHQRKK